MHEHREGRVFLCVAAAKRRLDIDDEPIMALNQRVGHVTEPARVLPHLRASRVYGSIFDLCVALLRVCPRASACALRVPSYGGSLPSRHRKDL